VHQLYRINTNVQVEQGVARAATLDRAQDIPDPSLTAELSLLMMSL